MTDPLVETKLLLPRPRRDLVPRPRLADRLRHGAAAPVTLVAAPAGFGKTTLLTSWFATRPPDAGHDHPVAWVSLDERDCQASSFWAYVLLALDRAVPGVGDAALTLLRSGQAAVETVLAGVVNELSVHSGQVTLVLDDYHLADGVDIAAGMTFLVDHLPPQLRVVIGTRADPALPLSRLRARGELLEVRAADLRFTGEEVATYLNDLNGYDLTPADLSAIESRTEGWVAALQLAALSLRSRDDRSGFIARFAGDDRFVVDYLADEVLGRQPDDVRRFLLDTSVLDRLNGPLCDAVSPLPGNAVVRSGRAMLESLERENLFLVPLDDQRGWYRYHHLFGDVLHAHLLEERPADVPDLHRRAAGWYADAGRTEDAVRHALAGGDVERAADLIEGAFRALGRERREDLLRRWAHELPDDVVRRRPVLGIALVGGLMASNDFDGVDGRLDRVEQILADPAAEPADAVVLDRAELARVPAAVHMYRAALALVGGDPAGAVARARRAVEAAVEGDDLVIGAAASLSGLASWTTGDIGSAHAGYARAIPALTRAGHIADVLGCSIAMADMELRLGRLSDAERTVAHALRLAGAGAPAGSSVLRGTADMLVVLSRVAWHRNDLAAAAEHLRRSDELGEGAALAQNPYRWRVGMARLRAAEGDLSTAVELLDEAERVYVGDYSPNVQPVHATRARVLAARGDVAEARAWARHHQVSADDDLSYLREYEHITLARILLAEHPADGSSDSLHDALALLDRLLVAAGEGGRIGTVIEVEVLRALGHRARGTRDEALDALRHALGLAEADGWVRVFVDAAPGLTDLLDELASSRPPSGYAHQLLAAIRAAGTAAGEPGDLPGRPVGQQVRRQPELVDPLSDRELEVLRLLGSDLDGPAIARQLVVSLNTVRTHTKHIYTKLGVNNRRAAISKAHQLGLLSRADGR